MKSSEIAGGRSVTGSGPARNNGIGAADSRLSRASASARPASFSILICRDVSPCAAATASSRGGRSSSGTNASVIGANRLLYTLLSW